MAQESLNIIAVGGVLDLVNQSTYAYCYIGKRGGCWTDYCASEIVEYLTWLEVDKYMRNARTLATRTFLFCGGRQLAGQLGRPSDVLHRNYESCCVVAGYPVDSPPPVKIVNVHTMVICFSVPYQGSSLGYSRY